MAIAFSLSIAIAAIIGWIRFEKINPAYYPFLFFIWIGLLNETISVTVVDIFHKKSILNNNIYVLSESLILTWQFKKWSLFVRLNNIFIIVIISFILLWFSEGFFISGINSPLHYFRIFYSVGIVLMSVSTINSLIVHERKNILKNPIFIICIGFLIYFTYKVIVWGFWLYGVSLSNEFSRNINRILIYINLFCNLIYALAVLWIPTRHRFSLPS